MKRKLIASLLCLCMLVSLLPAAAFAGTDGDTAGNDRSTATPFETSGGTTSDTGSGDNGDAEEELPTSPADAIITAFGSDKVTKEGNTYKLTDNVTLSAKLELTEDANITIDLNGHDITGAKDSGVFWIKNGSLTLTGTGSIKADSDKSAAIWVMAGCNALTIEKTVTITNTDPAGYVISVWKDVSTSSTITIKGTLSCANGLTVNGDVATDKAPTIIVDGAKITAKDTGLYLAGPANTTVTGSEITSESVGIEIRAGSLDVSDNTKVTSTGKGATTVSTNDNGSTTTNAAIAVSQHTTDKPINVTIDSATLEGTTALVAANPEDNGSAPANSAAIGVSVKDSTLTGDVVNAISKPSAGTATNSGVSISGGTVTGTVKDATIGDKGALTETDDKIGNASSVTLDKVNNNGTTLDNLSTCEAAVNGVRYNTFTDALTAAKNIDNAVVTLYKDIELTTPIKFTSNSIKINGQGHSINAGTGFTVPENERPAMIVLAATDGEGVTNDTAKLELSNVKLDAKSKARVIYGGTATLTINSGTTITGGVSPNNSTAAGLFMNGGKLVMNGGEITGNKIVGQYADDGYLQHSADLWVGAGAVAEIKGGTIGSAFFNSNGTKYGTETGAKVTMTGGSIGTAFVEAAANESTTGTATVGISNDASINEVLVAMDYSGDNRVVASLGQVTGTEDGIAIKGLEIPAGVNATVVSNGTKDTPATYTLTNGITIGAGAILTIPENASVNVQKSGSSSTIPTITNNGTLIVDGALVAGTDSDTDYLTFTGTGAVAGSGTIDVDPSTATATVKLDVAGGTGVDAEYTVIITDTKATFVLPIPTRSGYEFQGWKNSTGNIVTFVELEADDEVSFTAQWKSINSGGSSGGGGGVSSNVTIDRPTNGKVSVSPTAPSKGATVTINLTPDSGYVVGTVTVTDKEGNAVELTKVSDTKYTFTMPAGKVTVKATFTKVAEEGFTDVPADAYYADAVKWAVEKGITNGLTATTFGPNNSCTRGQMVTFLWRAAGSPAATGTNSFSDVASGEYYYNAVLWAVEKGITNGTSATTFSPNATVNRGQTVTFLYRYAESPAVTGDSTFSDVAADAYYADAVKWAVAEEITNGTSATTFAPASNCTRGQIVTFLYRQMAE